MFPTSKLVPPTTCTIRPIINHSRALPDVDVDGELRQTLYEKRLVEDELRKTKNSLDAVVSELVLSENEVFSLTIIYSYY